MTEKESNSIKIAHWQVIATSVCGTSHEKREQPCQDAHYWDIWLEDTLVAAVADGAGSAVLGEVGARIASQTVVETICAQETKPQLEDEEGWKTLLIHALKAAQMAVEREATTRKMMIRDLATTLILVIATPELVAAAQVGDGAVVIGYKEGNILTLTAPQQGEYLNETHFLISPGALIMPQIAVWRGILEHVSIFSDGLQMLALKMPDGTPYSPFFSPLFQFVAEVTEQAQAEEQLSAFLRSQRITERTDDDLTLLLATLIR